MWHYHNGELSGSTFTQNWYQRQRKPTDAESRIAYRMVVNESGKELADEAFKQHHREIRGCPGGATDSTPPERRWTTPSPDVSTSGVLVAADPVAP